MQILKHRTIEAISRLPDTADIKDIQNVLKRITKEAKDKIPEVPHIKGTEKTLASAFRQLRQICLEENYHLDVPGRINRENLFSGDL